MTPGQARKMYRRQLKAHGELMDVVYAANGASVLKQKILVRLTGYFPQELGGGTQVGERRAVVLAEDLEDAAFDPPLGTGGAYKLQRSSGDYLNVDSVDADTRRVAGVLVAYELRVTGL